MLRTAQSLPLIGLLTLHFDAGRFPPTPGVGLATRALTGHSLISMRVNEAAALPSPAVVLSARLDRYYDRLRRRSG